MTPEELHLRMIRFEPRTGGINDYPKNSDSSFEVSSEPDDTEQGGYVRYERTEQGWQASFVEPEDSVVASQRTRVQSAVISSELFWNGNLDDISIPPAE